MNTPTLTADLIEMCRVLAGRIIAPAVTAPNSGDDKTLHLDASVIIEVLICKTLIPIFTAVVSGLVLKRLAVPDKASQSRGDMEAVIKKLTGSAIHVPEGAEKEELVRIVEAQLSQLTDAETTARTLVDTILQRLAAPVTQLQADT